MKTKITPRCSVEFPEANGNFPGLHPVLARAYAARSITSLQDLDYSLANLVPFTQLMHIEQAVDLLSSVLQENGNILIVADFDADGATSCTVAMRALALMGAAEVSYISPNRFEIGRAHV